MHRRCRNQRWRPVTGGVVAVVTSALVLAGCEGQDPPETAPSSVAAFPDPPQVDGPLTVELRPALPLMTGDRRCRAEPGSATLCSPDGSGGYRAFGTSGPVVVDEVSTRLSRDHTSWATTVRFGADARDAVRRAAEDARSVGGVVVVTVDGQSTVVVAPAELGPGSIALLGLEKSEAWSVVDAFAKAESRSKQGM